MLWASGPKLGPFIGQEGINLQYLLEVASDRASKHGLIRDWLSFTCTTVVVTPFISVVITILVCIVKWQVTAPANTDPAIGSHLLALVHITNKLLIEHYVFLYRELSWPLAIIKMKYGMAVFQEHHICSLNSPHPAQTWS